MTFLALIVWFATSLFVFCRHRYWKKEAAEQIEWRKRESTRADIADRELRLATVRHEHYRKFYEYVTNAINGEKVEKP